MIRQCIFYCCEDLIEATDIPKSAEDVSEMFKSCTNLIKAADIVEGNNIKKALGMYKQCKKLTGDMYVKGALKNEVDVTEFFKDVAIAEGASLKLKYPASASEEIKATVDRLLATKSEGSDITKETY